MRIVQYFVSVEFELDGDSEAEALGNSVIDLPSYMTTLTQEELDEITNSLADTSRKKKMIVAAGVKPGTDDIVFLTATSDLMVLKNSSTHGIPQGRVVPVDFGHSLTVIGKNYEMSSDWAIAHASTLGITFLT